VGDLTQPRFIDARRPDSTSGVHSYFHSPRRKYTYSDRENIFIRTSSQILLFSQYNPHDCLDDAWLERRCYRPGLRNAHRIHRTTISIRLTFVTVYTPHCDALFPLFRPTLTTILRNFSRLMDPKQQAIAALQQVAQSAGHRDHTGKIAFNATTGSDMISSTTHNSVVSKQAHTDGQTQMMPETDRNWTGKEEGREHSTYATATNQPSSNSNDNSQSTSDSHGIATPPTSSSEGFSSQSTNQDGALSQLSQLSQLAAAQQPLASTTTRPKLAISPTAGQKRTADGQIKLAQSSPVNTTKTRGHSRNVSTISNVSNTSSKIREVRYANHHSSQYTDKSRFLPI
jgi:hypothetical protein